MIRNLIFIWLIVISMPVLAQGDKTNERTTFPIDYPPVFRGDLNDFIQENLIYPEVTLVSDLYGQVVVSFEVDTAGNTNGHTVVTGLHEELDNEALRVCRLIQFAQPAMQRRQPIAVTCTVEVNFDKQN